MFPRAWIGRAALGKDAVFGIIDGADGEIERVGDGDLIPRGQPLPSPESSAKHSPVKKV